MKAYLDSIPVAWPQANLLKPTFTQRRKDEDGAKAFSFTGDITFIGSDYNYIYAKLKTDPNALTNEVELKFIDDCCPAITPKNIFIFRITAETLRWCENKCELTAAAIEKSTQRDQITCLQNTLIWDNTPSATFPSGFYNHLHPRFTYCNELRPDWLHHVVLILGILVGIILQMLTPIVTVLSLIIGTINNIISAINVLPGININLIDFDGNPQTTFLQEYNNWKDKIMNWIIGCGRKHPAPFVRDYAWNVCEKCGLGFQSSIFDNPASHYGNACYHFAPVHKGVPLTGTSGGVASTDFWIDKNKPILSGFQFFEQLKGLVNGDWTIKNNTVIFERRDHFVNLNPWLDLTALPITEYEICYEWSKKNRPSYGNFHYQKDAVNTVGSEANRRWGEIIEWNSPPSAMQKGEFVPNNQFTTCRFRGDGIDTDILSTYAGVPWIGSIIGGYDNVIIMNQHTCYTPMFLIWDPNSGLSDARVSGTAYNFPNHPSAANNQFYNYPGWYWDHGNTAIYGDWTNADNNLYTNFFYIENPRLPGYVGLKYEATVEMTCARLQAMDLDGKIKTVEGNGKIDEIAINFENNTMTIKGEI